VIAGGGVRAVLELGGVRDVLTKSIGTQNPINLVKATMDGLIRLRRPEEVAELRGLTVSQVLGVEKSNGAVETISADGADSAGARDAETPAPAVPEAVPAEEPAAEPAEIPVPSEEEAAEQAAEEIPAAQEAAEEASKEDERSSTEEEKS
jgi:hypothetical protein